MRVSGWVFGTLACLELVLLLDIAFNWRWKLHDAGSREADAMGIYPLRRAPQQMALIAIGVAVLLASLLALVRFRRRPGAGLAVLGAVLSVGLWCVEVISYHFIDRVLYQKVGDLMLIAPVWAGLALMTCVGVWIDGRADRDTGAVRS